jgi:hypothetical protein
MRYWWLIEGALIVALLLVCREIVKRIWFNLADAVTWAIVAPGFVNEDLTYWDPWRTAGRTIRRVMEQLTDAFGMMAVGFADVDVDKCERQELIHAVQEAWPEVALLERACRQEEEWYLNEQDREYRDALGHGVHRNGDA